MSKYVKHKHGLIIGSDNVFFLKNKKYGFREYRSIFWAENYRFDDITGVNIIINTPAQQILWHKVSEGEKYFYILPPWIQVWFEKYVGEIRKDYDYANYVSDIEGGWDERSKPIFFRRRNDAVKLAKFIDSHLKGIKYDV